MIHDREKLCSVLDSTSQKSMNLAEILKTVFNNVNMQACVIYSLLVYVLATARGQLQKAITFLNACINAASGHVSQPQKTHIYICIYKTINVRLLAV
jgi:nanoRNase/pAp phosphatase (c-di-AMP/oligoRNAs hydrolase)